LIAMSSQMKKSDYESLAAFRSALRRFLAFSEAIAHEKGLTAQQYQALLAIKGHAGVQEITVGELAKELLLANHSASELTERMVGRGLLLRKIDPMDRRKARLALTAEAEAALEGMAMTHLEELRRIRPGLVALFDRFGA
jgi:DNA-binding MarR family transcriptional regulator